MRTITTAQRNQIAAGTLAIFTRFEIENPDLVRTDVSTALSTPDWFNEATLTESIDQVSQTLTAILLRDAGSLSLAPLRTDSTINRNSVPAYAPMLDAKRKWWASYAVVPTGTTPATADWKEVGTGYIDAIDVQGSLSTITVTGRDLLARLLDHYMHGIDGVQTFPPYSPSGTDSMETVIQQILDDELGTGRANVGSSGITLYTPVSPSYVMKPYTTGVGGLMDALTKVAQLAGMVLRYRYDASDVSRLTLLKPPRTATVADWTIGPSEYSVIPVNKLDITAVRTLIDLFYIDSSLGQQHVTSPAALTGTLTATAGAATFSASQAGIIANGALILVAGNKCTVSAFNGTTGCTLSGSPTFAASPWTTSASLTKYGERYMKVDLSGSLPMTAANAQAMADAIRSDLETPWLEQQFTSYALWFAQLYDYAKTLANGVQYNADQLGGVTSITHRLKGGTVKTDIGARGQPAGGSRLWTITGLTAPDTPGLAVGATPGSPNYSIAWGGTGVLLSVDGGTPTPPSASPITVARNAPGGADKVYTFTATSNGKTVSNTVTIPAQSGSTAPSASLVPSLTNNQLDDTTSPVTLTAGATNLPAVYTWAIYKGFSKGQYNGTAVYSGSNSTNPLSGPFTANVNPQPKNSQWFKLVVTVGADNYTGPFGETQVQGLQSFMRNSDGAPVRNTAWSDGGFAYNSHTSDGLTADANALEFGGRKLARLLAKGLPSDLDQLDSVPDGVTYKRPFASRINAGRPTIDFAEAIHSNQNADNIGDGSTFGITTKTDRTNLISTVDASGVKSGKMIRSRTFDDGNYAIASTSTSSNALNTAIVDDGGRTVNKFWAKGLSGDLDTADAFGSHDGLSHGITSFDQRTGGGRGFAGLNSSNRLATGVDNTSDILGMPAARLVVGASTSLFRETWDTHPVTTGRWVASVGSVALSQAGIAGPNVIQCTGYVTMQLNNTVAYNPSKLHRIRVRIRQKVDGGTAGLFYVGLRCLDNTGAAVNNNGGTSYIPVFGLTLTAANGWQEYTGWFTGGIGTASSGNTAVNSSTSTAVAPMTPNAGTTQFALVLLMNYSTGNNTHECDYIEIDVLDEDASARTYNTIDNGNKIQSGIQMVDGVQGRQSVKGYQSGNVADGGGVAFSPAYSQTPMVRISHGASTVRYEPRAAKWSGAAYDATKPQLDDAYIAGLGAGGGTMHAKLRQKAGATEQDIEFPTGNALTAASTATQAGALTNAPSSSGHYTVRYTYTLNVTSNQAGVACTETLVVVINKRAGGSGGAITELARDTFTVTDPDNTGPYTVSSTMVKDVVATLGSTDWLEVSIVSFVRTGSRFGTGSFSVHGENPTDDGAGNHGVQYFYGSADSFAANTPDTGDSVMWESWAVK